MLYTLQLYPAGVKGLKYECMMSGNSVGLCRYFQFLFSVADGVRWRW